MNKYTFRCKNFKRFARVGKLFTSLEYTFCMWELWVWPSALQSTKYSMELIPSTDSDISPKQRLTGSFLCGLFICTSLVEAKLSTTESHPRSETLKDLKEKKENLTIVLRYIHEG